MKAYIRHLEIPGSTDIFLRGQTVNILSLWPNGLSQLTQLCHCSTNTCHRQFLNEDESHSNLIYGDWDLYFTWFPCVTEYCFSSDFFFFLNFRHLQMQKPLLAHTSYKSRQWTGLGPWGGVGWLLGYSIRKERMVGWSGFHTSFSRRCI